MVRVRLTWADGDTRILDLSADAIAFYVNQGVIVTPIVAPSPVPSPTPSQTNLMGIFFTSLSQNNFNVRVDDNTRQRLGQEAQKDGRWSTRFSGKIEGKPTQTFEQVIRIIDEVLKQFPDPPQTECPVGFHRDPFTFQCVENDPPPPEEDRNLFQSAIIGVLALGAIGGSLLDKRRKR